MTPLNPNIARGIDRITYLAKGENDADRLPSHEDSTPPSGRVTAHLAQAIEAPNLQSYLSGSFEPRIADTKMLLPLAFSRALAHAKAGFAALATGHEPHASATPGDQPAAARAAAQAVRVLEEEADLRLLIELYRRSVYQG